MSTIKDYFKFIFVIVLVVLAYLSFKVLQPFFAAILSGLVLAYIFHPFFKRINKRLKNETLTAFILSLIVIVIIAVPAAFVIKEVSFEARQFYITAKAKVFSGNIFDVECPDKNTITCRGIELIKGVLTHPEISVYVEQGITKFSDAVLGQASQLIFSLPKIFINLFVAFFVCFYATLEGEHWVNRIKTLLPIRRAYQKEIFVNIDRITGAVIYGSVIVALIQGALGALGFFIFGVNSPILFGLLMTVFALIPFVGTAIIWAPAALLLMIEGYVEGETSLLVRGVLLFLYGTLVISTIDNILKPRIIGKTGKVHPVLVLLGVLGGLSLFGFIGFVIGPLILSLFMAFLEVYEREKKVIVS